MDDALLVGGVEGVRDLERVLERVPNREPPAGKPLGEGLSRHQLENEKPQPSIFFESVNRGDVGMVERREELRLAPETVEPRLVLGQLVGESLERDLAAKLGVAGAVDAPHSSLAEKAEDFVRTQALARRK